jgi:hypothetical protein
MPFDLINAPIIFQHFMNDVFHEYLDDFVVYYINDIFIFSKNLEEHEQHVLNQCQVQWALTLPQFRFIITYTRRKTFIYN